MACDSIIGRDGAPAPSAPRSAAQCRPQVRHACRVPPAERGRGHRRRDVPTSLRFALAIIVIAAFVCILGLPRHTFAADAAAPASPVRIVLVGDSTVTDSAGWGAGFKLLLNDRAECINTSSGGRSSK